MRHFACPLLAASSAAFLALTASAATRPRYGGTLRVDIRAKPLTLDGAESTDVAEGEAIRKFDSLIYDYLVRLDPQGQPQAALALSWEHDDRSIKWRFRLRPGVKWQDGAPLTPDDVVLALKGLGKAASVRLEGDALEIDGGVPSPGLLATLATDANLAIRRPSAGTPLQPQGSPGELPIGTGSFRLSAWEPGSHAVLQANEDYWDGRPYVDTIEIRMGRASRDALLDLEVGKADVVELDPVEARRAQQEGRKVWTSAPIEVFCLRFAANRPAVQDRRARLALAGSIDRAAIQKVLFQNYGEVAGSILPQWLAGYTFLFPSGTNLDQARQLMAEIGDAPALKVGYEASDTLARETAERVAVNARDAGIALQVTPLPDGRTPTPGPGVDLVVERVPIAGPTLSEAAREAITLGLPASELDSAEQTYAAERQVVDSLAVVPLIHLPELVGIGPRVMGWSATPWGDWRLESVSLGSEKP